MRYRLNKILKALALSTTLALPMPLLADNVQTSEVTLTLNLPQYDEIIDTSLFDLTDESTYNRKTSIYINDSEGRPLLQTFYFIKKSNTEWMVVTAVNGILVDFAPSNSLTDNAKNIVGIANTKASRLLFHDFGGLDKVYGGNDFATVPGTANVLKTKTLGAGIVSATALATQTIEVNFNNQSTELGVKPTHLNYDFTVWGWGHNGSSDNPISIAIEEITDKNGSWNLTQSKPVAINNNSQIALNHVTSYTNSPHFIRWALVNTDNEVLTASDYSLTLIDLNDNGEMVGNLDIGSASDGAYFINALGRTRFSRYDRAAAINNTGQILLTNNVNTYEARIFNHQSGKLDVHNPLLTISSYTNNAANNSSVNIPGQSAGVVTSITESQEPQKWLGLSDGGFFQAGIKYVATLDDPSCAQVDLHYDFEANIDPVTGKYVVRSKTLDPQSNEISTVDLTVPEDGVLEIQSENFIASNGLAHSSFLYSTPGEDTDGDGFIDEEIVMFSAPGQESTTNIVGCEIDFEPTYCTVDGASFDTVGEINQQCEFEAYNTKIGFGYLLEQTNAPLVPFVMNGMTDPSVEGSNITFANNELARFDSVLSYKSAGWNVNEFIDINEHNEFVGLGTFNSSDERAIVGRTAVLPAPRHLRTISEAIRNNPDTYDTFVLDWDNVPEADYYTVFALDGDGEFQPFEIDNVRKFTESYVTIQETPEQYTLAVKACNTSGCSFLSEPVTFIEGEDTDNDGLLNFEEWEFGSDITLADTDGDGLDDLDEHQYGTNPNNADSDNDGLTDKYEATEDIKPENCTVAATYPEYCNSLPFGSDTDGDGLWDGYEVHTVGTFPNKSDTDDDGLTDAEEHRITFTSPLFADIDNDGLNDKEEIEAGTKHNVEDTDGDGLNDGEEVNSTEYDLDPTNDDSDEDGLLDGEEVNTYQTAPDNDDTDSDGLSDYEEIMTYNTSAVAFDSDLDGLSDYDELFVYATLPNNVDTDNDGINDGNEVITIDGVPATGTSPTNEDTDNDGLSDGFEINYISAITGLSLNPLSNDTDGDSIEDNFEISLGLDPTDASDANQLVWVPIATGDITIFIPIIQE